MAEPQKLGLGEYFGLPKRRRRASGFVVTENRFEPGLRIPLHQHAYVHFTYVLSGGFVESYADAVFECPAGSLLIVPAGMPHTDVIDIEGAHTFSVELAPKLADRVFDATGLLREPRVIKDLAVGSRAEQLYGEFRSLDSASLLAIESLALDLLVAVSRLQSRAESSEPKWMPTVLQALHASPKRNYSLQELAELAGVHEAHLARSFRRAHGSTVGEYVRWLRLEEAKKALALTEQTVAEIGVDAGFYDQAHFSRAFRAAYGISPSAYRKSFKEG